MYLFREINDNIIYSVIDHVSLVAAVQSIHLFLFDTIIWTKSANGIWMPVKKDGFT